MKTALLYGVVGVTTIGSALAELTQVASFPDRQVTGVGVSPRSGRIFVNFPYWSPDHSLSVAEIGKDGKPMPYPTTGWNAQKEAIKNLVETADGAFVFGANFSVGVNLFYRITDFAAAPFARFAEYETFIEERHHSRKKDAPSGTALKLKDIVARHIERDFSISATRAGAFPGTHTVGFDSAADTVELTHTARSREGFATGAIIAAEWIAARKGFWEFTDVMDEILSKEE